ncbi:MAG TPA: hypothetical protein VI462_15385 [Acidimicrobiia bacterium]
MPNKKRSRQTRRYSSARPKSGAAMAKARKKAAWRKMGGGRGRATWPWVVVLTVVVVGGVVGIVASSGSNSSNSASSTSSNSGSPGPAIASVTSFDSNSPGHTIDGIHCTTNEQLAYHVHSHLAIFVNGKQMGIPMGIGIAPPRQTQPGATGDFVVAGTCFYELHAHTADGVIHIESPTPGKVYTLGEYFDIWNQPLGPDQVASAKGKVTAYRNGQLFSGNPRDILLGAHVVIQLDVGKVVAPKPYTFAAGL